METVTDTTVLDLIPFSIFIKDLESIYIYSNSVNAKYSGFVPESILGKTDFDIFPEEAARRYRADDRAVMESGNDSDRIEYVDFNNQDIIIRIIKRPYHDRSGEIIGVMGVYWEITEELKNKVALSDNRSQLEMVLKSAAIGVWSWDIKQKKLFWDEQINKIFGVSGSYEGERDYFISFIHPDERKKVSEELMISDMSETEINSEFRIVRPDGSIRFIQVIGEVHGDSENLPVKVIGVIHDITRKRLTEETLHTIVKLNQYAEEASMEEVLRLILKEAVRLTSSQLGFLFFIDEETGTVNLRKWLDTSPDYNEDNQSRPNTHISPGGILKECISEGKAVIWNSCEPEEWSPDIGIRMPDIIRKLASPIVEKKSIKAVISVVNKPGPYEDFDADQLTLLGENLWNIISRKRMLNVLEAAHEEALESNKVKDRFFSIIAHDLSNPISNIRILSDHFSTVVNESSPDMETMVDLSRVLSKSVITAQELLKNLLTWSRAQRHALEFQPETEIAKSQVEMAVAACKSIAEGKHILIKNILEEETTVYADSNMLQTILRNLLVNAIKFTPVRGEISVEVIPGSDETTFRIRDNGVGMSEDKVLSLFRIEELKSTRGTNEEKGTGLGLVLCKEFVDCHGGTIGVESSPGKGSVFTVSLPGPGKSCAETNL